MRTTTMAFIRRARTLIVGPLCCRNIIAPPTCSPVRRTSSEACRRRTPARLPWLTGLRAATSSTVGTTFSSTNCRLMSSGTSTCAARARSAPSRSPSFANPLIPSPLARRKTLPRLPPPIRKARWIISWTCLNRARAAFKHVHEIIHRALRIGGGSLGNVFLLAKGDGIRGFANEGLLEGAERARAAHVLVPEDISRQLVEENVVPTVDEVAARSPVSHGKRAGVRLRHASLEVRRTGEQVGGAIIFLQQSGPTISVRARRIKAIVVVRIQFERGLDLPHIVHTLDAVGRFLGAGQDRQQHARQNSDNRNHDQ